MTASRAIMFMKGACDTTSLTREMTGMDNRDGGVSAEVPVGRNVLEVPSDVDRLYEVIDFVKG